MTHEHAAPGYVCPICLAVQGVESHETLIKRADLVYRDELASAFIASFFIDSNPGHVLVVPNAHHENLYGLPLDTGHRIFEVTQLMSRMVRSAYACTGTTTLQNNEPDGDQHAFHYHQHVFPRYNNDDFHGQLMSMRPAEPSERGVYANRLREALLNDASID